MQARWVSQKWSHISLFICVCQHVYIYMHELRTYVSSLICICYIPYTAKLSRGETFAVVHKTHHSLENFRNASGPCHYVLYTANDSRGKLSRLAKKPRKFSPSKVLPYTVYCIHMIIIGRSCVDSYSTNWLLSWFIIERY